MKDENTIFDLAKAWGLIAYAEMVTDDPIVKQKLKQAIELLIKVKESIYAA